MCPSGQLDAHGTHIEAAGQATENSDLCPDHAGHLVQHLGRQLFRMGALVHRLEEPMNVSGRGGPRPEELGNELGGTPMLRRHLHAITV